MDNDCAIFTPVCVQTERKEPEKSVLLGFFREREYNETIEDNIPERKYVR